MRETRSARSFAEHTGQVQMWPHDRTPSHLTAHAPGFPEATRNAQWLSLSTPRMGEMVAPHWRSRRFNVQPRRRARSAYRADVAASRFSRLSRSKRPTRVTQTAIFQGTASVPGRFASRQAHVSPPAGGEIGPPGAVDRGQGRHHPEQSVRTRTPSWRHGEGLFSGSHGRGHHRSRAKVTAGRQNAARFVEPGSPGQRRKRREPPPHHDRHGPPRPRPAQKLT
jgi:hypothetical protein